jgi:hypothetical protein
MESVRSISLRVWARCLAAAGLLLLIGDLGCRPSPPAPRKGSTKTTPVDLLTGESGQLVQETWEAHFLRGAKVGHRQTRIYELPATDPPLLRIIATDQLEMRRFGDVTQQELTLASLETVPGQIYQMAYQLSGASSGQAATAGQRVECVVRDGRLIITRRGTVASATEEFAWPSNNEGLFAVQRSLARQPMQAGEERSVHAFLPLLDQTAQIQLQAIDLEETPCPDQDRRLLRIEAWDPGATLWGWKVPRIYWTDEAGQIWKSQEPFLDRQTVRVSQAEATRPNDLVSWDIGLDSGIPIDQEIADPYATTHAVYRVQLEGLQPENVFPSCLSQRLIYSDSSKDSFALLTVQRVQPDEPKAPDPADPGPQEGDLLPNPLIQSDDPRVVAIANAAAGSLPDPWRAATALEQYLFRMLGKVDISQVFSGAAEVAARRQGDCSEHAVLLAATCRARQIPARVVIGLVYSPVSKSFLYHMWTEVWITDRWISLDATLGRGGVGATHLKLRSSNLARESPYNLVSPVLYLMGKLQIHVDAIR